MVAWEKDWYCLSAITKGWLSTRIHVKGMQTSENGVLHVDAIASMIWYIFSHAKIQYETIV